MPMLLCYTVRGGTVSPGIRVSGDPPVVIVGEEGRGRMCTRAPVPPEAVIVDGQLIRVPSADPQAVAVVLIGDHAGYRGGWQLYEAANGLCPRANEGYADCPVCGAGYGHAPVRDGQQLATLPAETLGRVIARGYRAQGHAGRMGGGPEYLIAVHPGQFTIYRMGRLYGAPAWITVRVAPDGLVSAEPTLAALRSASVTW